MNRYVNSRGNYNDEQRNDTLRPIFEPNQLQNYGIWIELIPHTLRIIVTQFGSGPAPKKGQFIRLKQFVYLDNMVLVKSQRVSYPYGRNKMIEGLQICLAMCKQGFKARCFISQAYGYGDRKIPKIPPKSNLIIDIQVLWISNQPVSRQQFDDKLLIDQIITLAKQGDELVQRGDLKQAQRKFESAFTSIQSTRCKQIKHHLYSSPNTKYIYQRNQQEPTTTNRNIQKDKQDLVNMFKIFDIIKIKTVELALLNRDYYRVIMLSKQCMMESRLEMNQRILVARQRAFAEVGQFQMAIDLIKNLCDKYDNPVYTEQLKRIQNKKENFEKQTVKKIQGQPVLPFMNSQSKLEQTRNKRIRIQEQ